MEMHSFGQYLISIGAVLEEDVYEALNLQMQRNTPIGRIAVEKEILTVKQVMKILRMQADTQELFGEIAIETGFLQENDLRRLLTVQLQRRPKLGEILVEMGKIDQEERDQLLRDYHQSIAEIELAWFTDSYSLHSQQVV